MRVDSYASDAVRPLVGTMWAWEPETAPALIKVTTVQWNGEEWWIGTTTLAEHEGSSTTGREVWNDLSRFWEACHHVAVDPGPPGAAGMTRSGPARPDEVPTTTRGTA